MIHLALVGLLFAVAPGWAGTASADEPVRPDLSDPNVKREVQLDVLEGMYQSGLYEEALRVVAELRSQGIKDDRLDIIQAKVMSGRGLRTDAIAMLQALVKRSPRNADAWSALGVVYADHQKVAESIAALEKAARLAPGDASILNNLGYVQMAAGRFEPAVESFKKALVLDPSQARTRNNLGFALARAERDSEALEMFRSSGSEADARYNLGVACELRMDPTSALAHYQAALQSQPDHPQAKAALSRLLHPESP